MSDLVYPVLPVRRRVEREPYFEGVDIGRSPSAKEQRQSHQAAPRYRYRFRYANLRKTVAAPSPYQAYNQVSVVWYFFEYHGGTFDSFLYVDPFTGSQVRVRFESPALPLQQLDNAGDVWAGEVTLVSVL